MLGKKFDNANRTKKKKKNIANISFNGSHARQLRTNNFSQRWKQRSKTRVIRDENQVGNRGGTPLRTLHTCNGSLVQTQPVEEMNWDLARMTSH